MVILRKIAFADSSINKQLKNNSNNNKIDSVKS